MALSDADPRTSPSPTSARASSDPSKQRTTISDTTQKHLPPRQNEEQKAKRIRGRLVEITLISNRSGCRSTPVARPTTPHTEKKGNHVSIEGRKAPDPRGFQPALPRISPPREPPRHSPTGAISRTRRRRSKAGAGRGVRCERRARGTCTYHGGARDGYGGSGEARCATGGGAAVEAALLGLPERGAGSVWGRGARGRAGSGLSPDREVQARRAGERGGDLRMRACEGTRWRGKWKGSKRANGSPR